MPTTTEPHPILYAGIDFSQKRADSCVLRANGDVLEAHHAFANTRAGYQQAQARWLAQLQAEGAAGLRVACEATGYYWLPFFLQLAQDPAFRAAGQTLELYLHNARQVYWFKQSAGQADKSDASDPYYIAEQLRTRRRAFAWLPRVEWLALRFYTRLQFHLAQQLVRAKNYAHAHLFVLHSAYATTHPFADVFGATSGQFLAGDPPLASLAALSRADLAERLDDLSGHRLPDPEANARKLQHVLAESLPLPPALVVPLQYVLRATLAHLRFLAQQRQQAEDWLAREILPAYPGVACLDSIPGIGPTLAAGITAEIGDLTRFFDGPKWDRRHPRGRHKTLRDVEDAVAKFAGLWWPRSDSGDFHAEERHLNKRGNRYLRYYLIEAADCLRRNLPAYRAYYTRKYQEVPKHKHKRALVLTARKSVGLFVGLLSRQERYRAPEDDQH